MNYTKKRVSIKISPANQKQIFHPASYP